MTTFLTSDRVFDILMIYGGALLAGHTWARQWLMVIVALLAIGALLTFRKATQLLDAQRQVYAEHLGRAAADRLTAERMAAEVESAIKGGRVRVGADVLEPETQH